MADTQVAQEKMIEEGEPTFRTDTIAVMTRLRSALAELVGAVPGVRKASHMQHALELDPKLAWRIYRIAHAGDILAAGSKVPGPSSMKRFLEAAMNHGVSDRIIDKVQGVYGEFQELVKRHADDRGSFDTLVNGFAQGGAQIDVADRRAAYRANSNIYGIQARVHLACSMWYPSVNRPDRADAVALRGYIDLRRLRRDASWTVAKLQAIDDEGNIVPLNTYRALDGDELASAPSLLREFGTWPMPDLKTVQTKSGFVNVDLVGERVGKTSAITCFFGDAVPEMSPRFKDEHDHVLASCAMVRTPVETIVHDVLVHEDLFGEAEPRFYVLSDHSGEIMSDLDSRTTDILPIHETIEYLGKGPDVLETPDVPRYPEMARHVMEKMGWDGDRFDVYRCRVEYPVMPSSVIVEFELPEG